MTRVMKCPTCRKETSWQGNSYRPFCSARCRTTDLGAWAAESYRISGEQVMQDEEDGRQKTEASRGKGEKE